MAKRKRSSQEITDLIYKATSEIIEEKGISGLTVRGICDRATVEYQMFYNRFPLGFDDFLKKYLVENDFWLGQLKDAHFPKLEKTSEGVACIYADLWEHLNNNRLMNSVLRMELQENPGEMAIETAQKREELAKGLVSRLVENFEDSSPNSEDTRIFLALMTAGMYFLNLQKNISTFCGIDFSDENIYDKLQRALIHIIPRVLSESAPKEKK